MLDLHELEALAEEFLDGTDYLEDVAAENEIEQIELLRAIYVSEYSDIRELTKEKILDEMATSTDQIDVDAATIIDRYRDQIEQFFFDSFMQYFEDEDSLEELSETEQYEELISDEFNNIVYEILEEEINLPELTEEEMVEEADAYDEDSMIIEDFTSEDF